MSGAGGVQAIIPGHAAFSKNCDAEIAEAARCVGCETAFL
jgi:hypothetical protein